METISLAVNIAGIFIFLGLAAIAATIILLAGKVLFKRWFNWFILFLSAIAGGIGGAIFLVFGHRMEAVKAETTVGSISTLIVMTCSILLIMMTILPLMTMILRQRKIKIKELEDELKKLKGNNLSV